MIMRKSLLERSFGEISFKFRRWSAELAPDQSIEDTLVPEFWRMQAQAIMGYDKANPKGRLDIIEVRKPDTGMYAELLVTEVGPGFVRVRPIKAYEPAPVEVKDDCPLTTKWNFGRKLHDVIRRTDGQVMASGFQTKDAAVSWIDNHIKMLKPDTQAA
jgi:hypothetical protein